MTPSETPRVSVIIPCFNYGRFLKESLASVAAQTLKPIETLVIDDGSTDPTTLSILDNLSDPGVKVIHQENRGLAGARNSGIQRALGDYIYFLDADDVLFPECLAKLAGLLCENRAVIAACCGVELLGGVRHGTEWRARYDPYRILVENSWAAGLMLRKRSMQELSLTYDESMRHGYEDWEFNIRLVQTGYPIAVHPGALYYYRIHRNSMLNAARHRHAELVSYIRKKHQRLFTAENLMSAKRINYPALAILGQESENAQTEVWLTRQSFQDYAIAANETFPDGCRYRMIYAGVAAAQRLPPEAVECAIMFLESNNQQLSCIVAVRIDGTGMRPDNGWRSEVCQPIAIMTRAPSSRLVDVEQTLDECENLLRFADQGTGSKSGWKLFDTSVKLRRARIFRDPVAVRKQISAYGEKLLGVRTKRYLVSLYDYVYYRLCFSQLAVAVRRTLQRLVGEHGEAVIARIVFGAFLAKPPPMEHHSGPTLLTGQDLDLAPLFLNPAEADENKITILIVTAWLNQGGVEQEIIDLCGHLDHSRFNILIATTRRSTHPMDKAVRSCGVAIYHLADFLPPQSIRHSLAHLILQHQVSVMYIVHSREAYESLPYIKRVCPFLSVSDRNVTLAGGFPKISARLGRDHIDIRTAGHRKLVNQMSDLYNIAPQSLKVVYAGTDGVRLRQPQSDSQGTLHKLCNLRQDVPIVLFMGRLDPEKRPDVFVRIAAKIRNMRPDCLVHFAIVGDGEMRGELEILIAKLGVKDHMHLVGFQRNGRNLISDATLLMITSAYEGLALVSFEAMAVGTPQISANVGGQDELITPDIGVLIKNGFGEVNRYAHACTELLDDPNQRARMSVASKNKFTDQYSTENYVNEYSQIFELLSELTSRRQRETPSLRPPHIDPLRNFS